MSQQGFQNADISRCESVEHVIVDLPDRGPGFGKNAFARRRQSRQQDTLVFWMFCPADPAGVLNYAQQHQGGLGSVPAGTGESCAGDSWLVLQLGQHVKLCSRHTPLWAQFFVQSVAKELEQPLDQRRDGIVARILRCAAYGHISLLI